MTNFKQLRKYFFREKHPDDTPLVLDILGTKEKVAKAANLWIENKDMLMYIEEVMRIKSRENPGEKLTFDDGISSIREFLEDCVEEKKYYEKKKDSSIGY